MNGHLSSPLNEKTYPQIAFKMTKHTVTGAGLATVTGQLTIAGVTKPVGSDVKLRASANGVRSVGETMIDMTLFAITPPVVILGQMKVGKMVRVKFDATTQPHGSQQKARMAVLDIRTS